MNSSPQFPPTNRDFQVYQRVVLEAATTRQAAADFSLSQTRIRQIVQSVSQWLAETLPGRTEATDAAYLHLAQHLAADRLQYIYGQAMHDWRSTSESKYAGIVLRVIAATSKLPVISGTLEALAADAILGPLPDDTSSLYAVRNPQPSNPQSEIDNLKSEIPVPPPLRDCSTSPQITPATTPVPISPPSATSAPAMPSDNPSPPASATRRAFLAPAQPSLPTGDPPLTELKITPTQLGLSVKKNLSRRERRKALRAKLSA